MYLRVEVGMQKCIITKYLNAQIILGRIIFNKNGLAKIGIEDTVCIMLFKLT